MGTTGVDIWNRGLVLKKLCAGWDRGVMFNLMVSGYMCVVNAQVGQVSTDHIMESFREAPKSFVYSFVFRFVLNKFE